MNGGGEIPLSIKATTALIASYLFYTDTKPTDLLLYGGTEILENKYNLGYGNIDSFMQGFYQMISSYNSMVAPNTFF
uniref:Uncharacterized protein n=1 Tax=Megaviridae environmental sample TaxID=1737588 RepID=A0A5J6VI45_9VIRU|nr:MAG: hypothetical protein [Megaviridae environmental sample]